MPVAIAGMHRAGTSLIARMLTASGLDLGGVDQHLPPQPDNPEGFFEHRAFVDLNERLLAAIGGIWRDPPQPQSGWEHDPALDSFLDEARRLPAEYRLNEPWGWKDPRNSLTLPFWRRVFPELRIVVCVRHPLEVAYSLLERDYLPIRMGLSLWAAYLRQALADAPAERRIVAHYAAFFQRPEAELRRLTAALGLTPADSAIAAACNTVSPRMRHSRLGPPALRALDAGNEIVELYAALCKESDFEANEHDTLDAVEAMRDAIGRLDRGMEACVRRSWRLLDQEQEVLAREARIAAREANIDHLEAMIAGQRDYIDQREQYIGELQHHLALLGQRVAALEVRLSARRHRYADAVASAARRVMEPFRR